MAATSPVQWSSPATTKHQTRPDGGIDPYDDESLAATIDNLASDSPIVPDDSELSIAGLQNKILLVRDGERWHDQPAANPQRTS
jgi:hypothetical protein